MKPQSNENNNSIAHPIDTNEKNTATNLQQSLQSSNTKKEERKKSFTSTIKKELSIVGRFFAVFFRWTTIRILLAHHPYCEKYESHVFKIGPVRLCRGCWLSYPPAYATVIIYLAWVEARLFLQSKALWVENLWWFVIGFAILAIFGRIIGQYSLFVKDLSKFGRGAFAGFLVVVLLDQPWYFKIGAAILLLGGLTYLSIQRARDMEKTCQECEWHNNYSVCPGFKDFNNNFREILYPDEPLYVQNNSYEERSKKEQNQMSTTDESQVTAERKKDNC
jgi:hypothetical protein